MAKITLTAETFKALAQETRLNILKKLHQQRRTSTELARDLEYSKATIHEHLQQLIDADLIKKAPKDNTWQYYELTWKGREVVEPTPNTAFKILLSTAIVCLTIALILAGLALNYAPNITEPGYEELPPGLESPERDADEGQSQMAQAQENQTPQPIPDQPTPEPAAPHWPWVGALLVISTGLTATALMGGRMVKYSKQ